MDTFLNPDVIARTLVTQEATTRAAAESITAARVAREREDEWLTSYIGRDRSLVDAKAAIDGIGPPDALYKQHVDAVEEATVRQYTLRSCDASELQTKIFLMPLYHVAQAKLRGAFRSSRPLQRASAAQRRAWVRRTIDWMQVMNASTAIHPSFLFPTEVVKVEDPNPPWRGKYTGFRLPRQFYAHGPERARQIITKAWKDARAMGRQLLFPLDPAQLSFPYSLGDDEYPVYVGGDIGDGAWSSFARGSYQSFAIDCGGGFSADSLLVGAVLGPAGAAIPMANCDIDPKNFLQDDIAGTFGSYARPYPVADGAGDPQMWRVEEFRELLNRTQDVVLGMRPGASASTVLPMEQFFTSAYLGGVDVRPQYAIPTWDTFHAYMQAWVEFAIQPTFEQRIAYSMDELYVPYLYTFPPELVGNTPEQIKQLKLSTGTYGDQRTSLQVVSGALLAVAGVVAKVGGVYGAVVGAILAVVAVLLDFLSGAIDAKIPLPRPFLWRSPRNPDCAIAPPAGSVIDTQTAVADFLKRSINLEVAHDYLRKPPVLPEPPPLPGLPDLVFEQQDKQSRVEPKTLLAVGAAGAGAIALLAALRNK